MQFSVTVRPEIVLERFKYKFWRRNLHPSMKKLDPAANNLSDIAADLSSPTTLLIIKAFRSIDAYNYQLQQMELQRVVALKKNATTLFHV